MIDNSKVLTAMVAVAMVAVAMVAVAMVVVVVVMKSAHYPSMDGICNWWEKIATT